MSLTRIPVTSSNLRSVGYDPNTRTLEVEFHSGGIYQYSNVPSNIHDGLMNASSHGKYFIAYIRNSFGYRRIR